jgi:hypothetical protein
MTEVFCCESSLCLVPYNDGNMPGIRSHSIKFVQVELVCSQRESWHLGNEFAGPPTVALDSGKRNMLVDVTMGRF